jgi:hypothetical protein
MGVNLVILKERILSLSGDMQTGSLKLKVFLN